MTNKVVHVIGGGTRFHIDPHLYLGSKATGKTARRIAELCRARPEMDVKLHLTAMAEPILEMPDEEQGPAHHVGRWINNPLDTNRDLKKLVQKLVGDTTTKIVFFSTAVVDFEGYAEGGGLPGRNAPRPPAS